MITFYPGLSRVNSKVLKYFKDAFLDGILSINHRSGQFEKIYGKCTAALKEKLGIPEEYTILFASSATECWEIIAQSLVEKSSFHLYNGAFGRKWFDYTKSLKAEAKGFMFDLQQPLDVKSLDIPLATEVIAVTQNETSNGTTVDNSILQNLRVRYPGQLIAVDATSSMAGIQLDFQNADVWYASVQKCFGLPAGLSVMICSPKAIEKAKSINERGHYNSLAFMVEMAEKNQTTYTPNVLNIYLLMRVMEAAPPIAETEQKILARYKKWLHFLGKFESVSFLIQDDLVRSRTVLTLTSSEEEVKTIKETAKKAGIMLGNGYGELKSNTFRIANFPAIKSKEIKILTEFFENNLA